jgi:hypothetical protein
MTGRPARSSEVWLVIVDDEGWDEFGERIASVGTCAYCGEELDEWEIFVEPEIRVRRPVLLWKHRRDGVVICRPAAAATPVTGSESRTR